MDWWQNKYWQTNTYSKISHCLLHPLPWKPFNGILLKNILKVFVIHFQGGMTDLLYTSSSECLRWPGLRPSQSQKSKTQSGPPIQVIGTPTLEPWLAASQVHYQEVELEVGGVGTPARTPIWNMDVPSGVLTYCAKISTPTTNSFWRLVEASAVAFQANPLSVTLTSPISSGSYPGSTSDPSLYLGPGKAEEDGSRSWAPVLMWEIQKELLTPSFRPAQLWPWWLFGEMNWMDVRYLSLSLSLSLSLCLSL